MAPIATTNNTRLSNRAVQTAAQGNTGFNIALGGNVFIPAPTAPVKAAATCKAGVCETTWKPVKPVAAPQTKALKPVAPPAPKQPEFTEITAHVGAIFRQNGKLIGRANARKITFDSGNTGYVFDGGRLYPNGEEHILTGGIALSTGGVDMTTPNLLGEITMTIVEDDKEVNTFGLFARHLKSKNTGFVPFIWSEELSQTVVGRTVIDGLAAIAMRHGKYALRASKVTRESK